MIKTQVYLPRQLYKNVQILARKENVPAAELVRNLLTDAVVRKTGSVGEALKQLATVRGKGPADLSRNIDTYLYEK